MRAHLADRNGRPLCGDRPWHFQTTSRFAQTLCTRCVGLVRTAATDAGLQDPCRPKSVPHVTHSTATTRY